MHRTDAHALHAILTAVAAEPHSNGLRNAWVGALQAEGHTPEFSRRHGEVVGLFSRTVQQIHALPEAKRVHYEPWVADWWNAVVTPTQNWDAGLQQAIIQPAPLSLLHAAGDLIETSLDGTSSAPGGASIETLEAAVAQWVEDLTGDQGLLPHAGLRKTIIEQLQHVLWLIERRDLFGLAPVAASTQEVVGAMALAAPSVPAKQQARWKSGILSIVGALTIFNGMADQGQAAIGNASEVITRAIEVADRVADDLSGNG